MIILLVLFLGLATVWFVAKDCISIQKVVREGAREAVITGSEDRGISMAYRTAWLWGLDPDRLTVSFSRHVDGTRTFETCYATYRVNLFSHTFPALVGRAPLSDFDVKASAVFGWRDQT